MIVVIDLATYLYILKVIVCPFLIGVGITVVFFRIREWIVNKRMSE